MPPPPPSPRPPPASSPPPARASPPPPRPSPRPPGSGQQPPRAPAPPPRTSAIGSTGTILAVTIGADGWWADIQIAGLDVGGSYNLGLGAGNDPDAGNPTLKLAVTSLGYDDAGAPTTTTRTIYATKAIRKPYPNQATNQETFSTPNVTVRVALSDYIYQADTSITANVLAGLYTQASTPSSAALGLAVTNTSTRAYPAVIGNWTTPGYDKLGSTFKLRAACYHHSAQQGRPVRAVVFTATDQHSNTITQTILTPTVDATAGDAIPVVEYVATINAATLTQGDTLTLNFTAYPWIGDSGSIMDSSAGATQPTPLVGPIFGVCDKTGAYCTSVAVVDPTSGNDTTGAVTGSFNPASPPAAYQTLGAAFNALCAYNNTHYSRNNAGGSIIYLRGTSAAAWAGGTQNTTTDAAASLLIAAFPGDTGCAIGAQSGDFHLGNLMKLQALAVNDGGSSIEFSGGNFLWFDQCTLHCTGTAPIYGVPIWHVTRTAITAFANGLAPFSTPNASPGIVRGNTGTPNPVLAYTVIGNYFTGGIAILDTVSGQTTPATTNLIIAYNRLNGGLFIRLAPVTDAYGAAIIQNLSESLLSPDTSAVWQIAADSATNSPVNNVLIWHNTIVGGRANLGYNDTGTSPIERWGWSLKANLFDVQCIKADTFNDGTGSQNAARVGNWPFMYGVGASGNINGDYNGYSASASFCWEFLGLKSDQQPTTGSPPSCTTRANTYPQYTNRQSYNGTGGTGAGGGDYHIAGTSPAASLQRDWVLRYDLAGRQTLHHQRRRRVRPPLRPAARRRAHRHHRRSRPPPRHCSRPSAREPHPDRPRTSTNRPQTRSSARQPHPRGASPTHRDRARPRNLKPQHQPHHDHPHRHHPHPRHLKPHAHHRLDPTTHRTSAHPATREPPHPRPRTPTPRAHPHPSARQPDPLRPRAPHQPHPHPSARQPIPSTFTPSRPSPWTEPHESHRHHRSRTPRHRPRHHLGPRRPAHRLRLRTRPRHENPAAREPRHHQRHPRNPRRVPNLRRATHPRQRTTRSDHPPHPSARPMAAPQPMELTYARVRRHQHHQAMRPVTFQPTHWQPQVRVTFTRDVNGWLDRDQNIKWHFAAGSTHMIDEQHAVEFIIKGYATGELPRFVSADEQAELRSVITIIGLNQPQTRNGGDPHG